MAAEFDELIGTLERVREALLQRLGASASWRALMQLDARETSGQPLSSIDGARLRTALERDLAGNRAFVALRRLDEAVAALRLSSDVGFPATTRLEIPSQPPNNPLPLAALSGAVRAKGFEKPAPAPQPTAPLAAPERPADDLTRIRGLSRTLAATLANLGVRHYATIAGWTAADVAHIGSALGLGSLISRQNWIEQAALLEMRRAALAPPSPEAATQAVPTQAVPTQAAPTQAAAGAAALDALVSSPVPAAVHAPPHDSVAAQALAAILGRVRAAAKRSPESSPLQLTPLQLTQPTVTQPTVIPCEAPPAGLAEVVSLPEAVRVAAPSAMDESQPDATSPPPGAEAATASAETMAETTAEQGPEPIAAGVPLEAASGLTTVQETAAPPVPAPAFELVAIAAPCPDPITAVAPAPFPEPALPPLEPITVIRVSPPVAADVSAAVLSEPDCSSSAVPYIEVEATALEGVAPDAVGDHGAAATLAVADVPAAGSDGAPSLAPDPEPQASAARAVPEPVVAVADPLPPPPPVAPPPELPPDPLELIDGIDASTARRLMAFGVKHFTTIAGWSANDVVLREVQLLAPRRIRRQGWIEQAALLARGDLTAYATRRLEGWETSLTRRPADEPWIALPTPAAFEPLPPVPAALAVAPGRPLPPAPPPVMPTATAPPPAPVARASSVPYAEPAKIDVYVSAPACGAVAVAVPARLVAAVATVEPRSSLPPAEPPPEPVYIPDELEEAPEHVEPPAETLIEPGGAAALAAAAAAASVMTAALKASSLRTVTRHRRSLAEALQPLAPATPVQDLRKWSVDIAEELCPPVAEPVEPDTGDLSVGEAEVLIVAREPVTDARSLSDLRSAAAAAAFKARQKERAEAEEFDAESYAAYRGEVEEAAVEIVTRYPVPVGEPPAPAAGQLHPSNSEGWSGGMGGPQTTFDDERPGGA